jgi:hypothetical protein
MPLSEEIRKQVESFSSTGKQGELVNYMKEKLKHNICAVQDILNYARDYQWKSNKSYVVVADSINKLGVVVNQLEDVNQKKLDIEFFKLAAERDSDWGNKNCATLLLNTAPQEALQYARKAVELSNNKIDDNYEHKYILHQALFANGLCEEAVDFLWQYLVFKFKKSLSEKDSSKNKKLEEKIKNGFESLDKILDKLIDKLQHDQEQKYYQDIMTKVTQIVNDQKCSPGFSTIKEKARFMKGLCHEKLGEKTQAWRAYCEIVDTKLQIYVETIAARIRLLKQEIKAIENSALNARMTSLGIMDETERDELQSVSDEVMTELHPSRPRWQQISDQLHSIDMAAYNAYLAPLEQTKIAKRKEFFEIQESLEKITVNEGPDNLEQKKQLKERSQELKKEQTQLEQQEKEFKLRHKDYLPEERQRLRRYKAECRFFTPNRSRKISDITALAGEIIDHRFTLGDSNKQCPIKLTGKSSRLFISAERLFQDAVVSLSGNETPKLGVPVIRKQPWNIGGYSGSNDYGAVEFYSVKDTIIRADHRANPKKERLGCCYVYGIGKYTEDVYHFLSTLTDRELVKESQLAKFMIRYSRTHQTIAIEELQAIYTQATILDVKHFNEICFLILEKEQAQWHPTTLESCRWGASIAQARCLIMIEAGFISFSEAFKNKVLFGVYSEKDLIGNSSQVTEVCKNIEELYIEYLQYKDTNPDRVRLFKTNITQTSVAQQALTRKQAREDMRYIYGGESDTDGDGYDTEVSLSV